MEKLKEILNNLLNKFKGLTKAKKIAIVIFLITIIITIISLVAYSNNDKYKILFSNLDPKDAKVVSAKLKELKVDTKVDGNTILVPKERVDELRLDLATDITNGSSGYELMDNGSSFGMSDEEFKVKKLRMLQGEVEKTIKSFPQIKNTRVHITPAEDSVFVKDKEPGKASVYIELKSGEKLNNDQVRSIIALISGTTENMPNKNIEVIDQDMNLLSEGLFDDEEADGKPSSSSVGKQQDLQKNYEKTLEENIYSLLEPVVGKGKVKATVNATLDFDSKQKTEVVVDPNKVITNQHTIKDDNTKGASTESQSPIDNNMTNSQVGKTDEGKSQREEQTTEYTSGKTENKVISAPGEVKRLTSSVVVDGVLDGTTEDAIKNIVSNAVGFKDDRGDTISIVGMQFDPTAKDEAKKEIDAMKAKEEEDKKISLYKKIGIGAGVLILAIIVAVLVIRRIRKKHEEEEHEIDMMINDSIEPKEIQKFEPIDFETKNENVFVEDQVKKYANQKPDQVLDIIKSWLADDER